MSLYEAMVNLCSSFSFGSSSFLEWLASHDKRSVRLLQDLIRNYWSSRFVWCKRGWTFWRAHWRLPPLLLLSMRLLKVEWVRPTPLHTLFIGKGCGTKPQAQQERPSNSVLQSILWRAMALHQAVSGTIYMALKNPLCTNYDNFFKKYTMQEKTKNKVKL